MTGNGCGATVGTSYTTTEDISHHSEGCHKEANGGMTTFLAKACSGCTLKHNGAVTFIEPPASLGCSREEVDAANPCVTSTSTQTVTETSTSTSTTTETSDKSTMFVSCDDFYAEAAKKCKGKSEFFVMDGTIECGKDACKAGEMNSGITFNPTLTGDEHVSMGSLQSCALTCGSLNSYGATSAANSVGGYYISYMSSKEQSCQLLKS